MHHQHITASPRKRKEKKRKRLGHIMSTVRSTQYHALNLRLKGSRERVDRCGEAFCFSLPDGTRYPSRLMPRSSQLTLGGGVRSMWEGSGQVPTVYRGNNSSSSLGPFSGPRIPARRGEMSKLESLVVTLSTSTRLASVEEDRREPSAATLTHLLALNTNVQAHGVPELEIRHAY
ncbi:hypothetical protein LX32DRAFT_364208 [Colletotrichum zoysiae]|uniref:Uncharacterized protein n=1 Tax=Colletotrichum zoysiae TaxID=1216348 RepID=A0AAD9M590_9PEZI|nr:hypothetical protein LX32DRAFT_364208 [Colletotrichum zoysiae]